MDTREKIVPIERLTGTDWIAVAGLFDPLTVTQAERLRAVAERNADKELLAVVIPGRDTLLTASARAALVAGLRTVTAVVVADPADIRALGMALDEDAQADQKRSEEFVQFVVARHSAK